MQQSEFMWKINFFLPDKNQNWTAGTIFIPFLSIYKNVSLCQKILLDYGYLS